MDEPNSEDIKTINVGFGNVVIANRIVAVMAPDSSPVKRRVSESRDKGLLIDATFGRRSRSVIITDSEHVVLSAVQPETVKERMG
ncbi:DUF370 domain-containing protein [Natranaerofaba carboxydovora]|uniref:DUF370 domain-containing protein n=1 Tax=Natranaerofaba carboxydovora TaxID=2742683 RepID=UPI0024026B49|nr:DUF370 domain-containing protein [Natranaerofaba carboxydovora]UMZ72971.1 hypothetical protein ACONDI_00511 [Natranaerofaba carboxydovora]